MLSVLYIFSISALFVLTERFAPKAKFEYQGFTFQMMLLGWLLTAALIGWHLPTLIQENFSFGMEPGWLTRTAQVFGALCGFMIAIRAAVLIGVVFVVGVGGLIAWKIANYIVAGN